MKKRFIIFITIAFVSLLFLEFFLRIAGFKPKKYLISGESSISIYDSELGWRLKTGKHLINSINGSGDSYKITIEKNGSRRTGEILYENKSIIVIGGSFSQGSGVPDEESYAFKLRKFLPNFNIYNFGQPGYSTIQSLLLLKKEIKKINKPKIVIYGFIDHHIQRNIARSEWLDVLLQYSNKNNDFKPSIPFGLIDENQNLVIKPLIGHATFPLRESSSLIAAIEKVYMKQITRKRKKDRFKVLYKSIDEINKISKSNNSKLFVVNLSLNKKRSDKKLNEYLKKNKISYIDCRTPSFKKYKIKNDYHPNFLGHQFYSKCIYEKLRKHI